MHLKKCFLFFYYLESGSWLSLPMKEVNRLIRTSYLKSNWVFLSTQDKGDSLQGFPNGVDWWGDNLDKMAKNCMKITKLAFLCQNSGGTWGVGQANFWGSGGITPSPPH